MQHPEMPVCIQLNTLRHPKADDQTDTQTKNTQAEGGGYKLFQQAWDEAQKCVRCVTRISWTQRGVCCMLMRFNIMSKALWLFPHVNCFVGDTQLSSKALGTLKVNHALGLWNISITGWFRLTGVTGAINTLEQQQRSHLPPCSRVKWILLLCDWFSGCRVHKKQTNPNKNSPKFYLFWPLDSIG